MTPRQHEVLGRIVLGLSFVAMVGILALAVRGYLTLALVLTGVMCGLSALTFRYARSETLTGLFVIASAWVLSLMVHGYFTLVLVILLTICGSTAVAFLYYDGSSVWSWWFPDEEINPTLKRWLRYLLQAITVALAYVQARFSINALTGVDPGNFPTALTALTVLTTLVMWLVIIPAVLMVMSAVYGLAMLAASAREQARLSETPGISQGRWGFRAFGAFSFACICIAAYGLPSHTPAVQRAVRVFVSHVLVATEFSYDRTCAISSERRLVAQLRDRRERQVSLVSIAEEGAVAWFIFRHFTFSTGTCNDPQPPAAAAGAPYRRIWHDPAEHPGPGRHPGGLTFALASHRLRRGPGLLEAWGTSLFGAIEALQALAMQRVAEADETP